MLKFSLWSVLYVKSTERQENNNKQTKHCDIQKRKLTNEAVKPRSIEHQLVSSDRKYTCIVLNFPRICKNNNYNKNKNKTNLAMSFEELIQILKYKRNNIYFHQNKLVFTLIVKGKKYTIYFLTCLYQHLANQSPGENLYSNFISC